MFTLLFSFCTLHFYTSLSDHTLTAISSGKRYWLLDSPFFVLIALSLPPIQLWFECEIASVEACVVLLVLFWELVTIK